MTSAGFAALLRVAHAQSLAWTTWLATIPMATYSVALLLFCRSEDLSYGTAGILVGAWAIGVAAGAPFQGRCVDRWGPRLVLPISAAAHAASMAALILSVSSHLGLALPLLCAVLTGGSQPRIAAVARSVWSRLLASDDHLLSTAYALDSLSMESTYLVAPLLVAAGASLGMTEGLLLLAGAGTVVSTLVFVSLPAVRKWRTSPDHGRHRWYGVLGAPAIRLLVLGALAIGLLLGGADIVLLAFAAEHGAPAAGALLVAGISIGSGAAALIYGAQSRRPSPSRAYVALLLTVPVTVSLLLLGTSIPVMFVLTLPAGAAIAPLFAFESMLISRLAAPGTATEAFTLMGSATFLGAAAGSALGGAMVAGPGWRATLVCLCLAGTTCIVPVASWRSSLRQPEVSDSAVFRSSG